MHRAHLQVQQEALSRTRHGLRIAVVTLMAKTVVPAARNGKDKSKLYALGSSENYFTIIHMLSIHHIASHRNMDVSPVDPSARHFQETAVADSALGPQFAFIQSIDTSGT